MKKVFGALLLVSVVASLQACDICGLSSSANYFGILPNADWNFAGFRYQYRSYHSEHNSILTESGLVKSDDFYNTIQFWGRYSLLERFQIYAFLPYNIYNQRKDGIRTTISGLADASLLVNYTVLNTSNKNKAKWKHLLQLGGGIKFPTGNSDISTDDLEVDPVFQSGTGSYDFPINSIYTLLFNKMGINTENSYSFNTSNKEEYKYGNRFTSSINLFYQGSLKKLGIIPNVGINYEHADSDTKSTVKQLYTGGDALYANAGFQLSYKKISLGILFQQPISQNIGGGKITSYSRCSTSLIYLF